MIIRDAILEDAIPMVTWGSLMHEQSQFAQYNWDDFKVLGLVKSLIKDERGIAIVIENENGVIVGGMIGRVDDHFFGNNTIAYDYAVFIAPEFRKSTVGIKLIKAYIDKAKSLGADEITLGNSTGNDMDRVAKLYERMGFIKYGYNFRMNGGK